MTTIAKLDAKLAVTGKSKFDSQIKSTETKIQKLGKSFKSMGLASKIGFAAVGLAVTNTLKNATLASIQFEQRFTSFTRLIEGDADRFLDSLKRAADGTVSSLSLVTQANTAILLGLEQEQLPRLLKASRLLGAAVGRTTEEAFADLTVGIGRQSRMILDNLGIIVKAGEAYDAYAKKIGISTEALTAQQRQAAFMEATMLAIKDSTEKLKGSITDATTETQKFNAEWKDFLITIGGPTKFVLTGLLGFFNAWVDAVGNAVEKGGVFAEGREGTFQEKLGGVFGGDVNTFKILSEKELEAIQKERFEKEKEAEETRIRQLGIAQENIDLIIKREEEYKELLANIDITRLSDLEELRTAEKELNNLRKDGVEIMGSSFNDLLNMIRVKTEEILNLESEAGTFVNGQQVGFSEMREAREEARNRNQVTSIPS